jgi:hypothetical protein
VILGIGPILKINMLALKDYICKGKDKLNFGLLKELGMK